MEPTTAKRTGLEVVDELHAELRVGWRGGRAAGRRPASTYRLQLTKTFGFADAASVVPYLAELGVTDVYLSPILAAARGSTHGYGVVDHGRLNDELGGEPAYLRLCEALAAHSVVDARDGIALAELLSGFPVALLASGPEGSPGPGGG
jgi:hypothetical protein